VSTCCLDSKPEKIAQQTANQKWILGGSAFLTSKDEFGH
jgi:hypothetical protein